MCSPNQVGVSDCACSRLWTFVTCVSCVKQFCCLVGFPILPFVCTPRISSSYSLHEFWMCADVACFDGSALDGCRTIRSNPGRMVFRPHQIAPKHSKNRIAPIASGKFIKHSWIVASQTSKFAFCTLWCINRCSIARACVVPPSLRWLCGSPKRIYCRKHEGHRTRRFCCNPSFLSSNDRLKFLGPSAAVHFNSTCARNKRELSSSPSRSEVHQVHREFVQLLTWTFEVFWIADRKWWSGADVGNATASNDAEMLLMRFQLRTQKLGL